MPFRSKRQQRFMYATKPKGVDLKEWSSKTDFSKLPERVRKKRKKSKKDRNDVFQGPKSLEAHGDKALRLAAVFESEVKRASDEPAPGMYRHFKGGRYQVLFIARYSEGEEPVVVYLNSKGEPWVRPLKMWNELTDRWPDGVVRPRFVPESEAPSLEP